MENPALNPSAAEFQSPVRSGFLKLFGIGVIGWLLASVVGFLASWTFANSESLPTAFMWTISHWWAAFAFGLLLLVGYGLKSKLPFGRALLAYSLPVVILVVLAAVCLAVYPDSGFRMELSTYLPLVMMFYILGLLWVSMSKETRGESEFARAVIPSLVGGLIILGFVAVPVFGGDAFRYRDAFQFTITKTTLVDGEIHSDATIEIRKPGHYEFVTPRCAVAELMSPEEVDSGRDIGTISWGSAGAPGAGQLGSFPLQIVWRKGLLPANATKLPDYENSVFMDVRDVAEGNREIYYLTAPMDKL